MEDRSMISPVHGAQSATPASLLQLPGEIRNRIYDFALTPCLIGLTPPSHQAKSSHRTRRAGSNAAWWLAQDRKALGLTQTSRQLRAEFLPLHQKAVAITICCGPAVEWYIRDFFPILANANGSLYIGMQYGKRDLDLTPLMRLSCAAPGFKVSMLYCYGWGLWRTKSRKFVVSVLGNEKWRKYFDEGVVQVLYSETFSQPQLFIEVSAGAAEDWMSRYPSTNGEFNGTYAQAAEEWRTRVGLDYPELLSRRIVVSVAQGSSGNDGQTEAASSSGEHIST